MSDQRFFLTCSEGFAGGEKYLLNAEDSRSLQALMATPPTILAVAASAGWEPWAIEVRLVRPDEMPPLPDLYQRFLGDGWTERHEPVKKVGEDSKTLGFIQPPPFDVLGCYCWSAQGAAPYILLCPERIMACSRFMNIGWHLHPQARYAYLLHAVLLHEMGHHALATHRPLTSKSDLHWEEGLANWLMLAWVGTLADVEFTGYVHAFVDKQPEPYARGLRLFNEEQEFTLVEFWKKVAHGFDAKPHWFLTDRLGYPCQGPGARNELVEKYSDDHFGIEEWFDVPPSSPFY